jgi:arginase family enzyme
MRNWVIIGVPTSAGYHYAGQELAPAALRAAGLAERLRAGTT